MATLESSAEVFDSFLWDVQTIRYSELASSTVILYDHLITLDQEYHLIWNAPWTLGKCLFLINRYYTLTVLVFNNYALFSPNITDSVSSHWYRWQGWTGMTSFIIAQLILLQRLYALYLRDKRVLLFMTSISLLASAASAGIIGKVLSEITVSAHPFPGNPLYPGGRVCWASNVSTRFYWFWVPMLVSESVLCGLAIFRIVQNYREGCTLFQTGRRLLENLIRDSVFYYVVMFAAYLVNALVFIRGSGMKVEIPIGWVVALPCVLGNRLCLNARGMVRGEEPFASASDSSPPISLEDIDIPDIVVEDRTHLSLPQFDRPRHMRPDRPVASV